MKRITKVLNFMYLLIWLLSLSLYTSSPSTASVTFENRQAHVLLLDNRKIPVSPSHSVGKPN